LSTLLFPPEVARRRTSLPLYQIFSFPHIAGFSFSLSVMISPLLSDVCYSISAPPILRFYGTFFPPFFCLTVKTPFQSCTSAGCSLSFPPLPPTFGRVPSCFFPSLPVFSFGPVNFFHILHNMVLNSGVFHVTPYLPGLDDSYSCRVSPPHPAHHFSLCALIFFCALIGPPVPIQTVFPLVSCLDFFHFPFHHFFFQSVLCSGQSEIAFFPSCSRRALRPGGFPRHSLGLTLQLPAAGGATDVVPTSFSLLLFFFVRPFSFGGIPESPKIVPAPLIGPSAGQNSSWVTVRTVFCFHAPGEDFFFSLQQHALNC